MFFPLANLILYLVYRLSIKSLSLYWKKSKKGTSFFLFCFASEIAVINLILLAEKISQSCQNQKYHPTSKYWKKKQKKKQGNSICFCLKLFKIIHTIKKFLWVIYRDFVQKYFTSLSKVNLLQYISRGKNNLGRKLKAAESRVGETRKSGTESHCARKHLKKLVYIHQTCKITFL